MGANWNSSSGLLDSSNYCEFTHRLSFLSIKEQSAVVLDKIRPLLNLDVHFERGHLIDSRYMCSMQKHYACIALPLDHNFSIIGCVVQSQSAVSPQRSTQSA